MNILLVRKTICLFSIIFALVGVHSSATASPQPADIIIVVDNSDSMALEASEVKDHVNSLVQPLAGAGIDTHVIIISKTSNTTAFDILDTGICAPAPVGNGSCPDDENLPGYRHVVQEISSTDALHQVINTYDDWKSQLRSGASKMFLVVSDDDSDMSAQTFTNTLATLNPPILDFVFNSIVATEGPASCALCVITGCAECANPCCDKSNNICAPLSSEEGQVYNELTNASAGISVDLCDQDFSQAFADMATEIMKHNGIDQTCFPVVSKASVGAIVCL